ncbi:MAG: YggT family protein [Chloroflexi bacterium]|nr:YggT family protein [Chloroflexota bacterium]
MGILINFINILYYALYFLILARIIFSFVRVSPYHPTWGPILRFVHQATEPIMAPVRNILPPMGGLDFSPILILFVASFLRRLLISIILSS